MKSISVMLCGCLGASACQMLSHTHTHQTSTTFSQQSKQYKHLKSVILSNISHIKQYQSDLLLTSPLCHNIHPILHLLVAWHNWPRTELTLTHARLEGEVIEHDHPIWSWNISVKTNLGTRLTKRWCHRVQCIHDHPEWPRNISAKTDLDTCLTRRWNHWAQCIHAHLYF